MNSKIQNDIKELVEQQVISKESASKMEAYYQSKKVDVPNRMFTVFGVLGGLLIGLGIILILAHNWDDFSKSIKTSLAFLPLVLGQVFVGISIFKNKNNVWKESTGTLLFFVVGSCISLISQIYNIPGNFSDFILTWILLCFPLIYFLRSHSLAILHIIFMTFYAADFGYSYLSNGKTPWYYLLLLGLVFPHYWQLLKYKSAANITSIFNWLFPLSLNIVLGTFVHKTSELGVLMYVVLYGIFYSIGKMPLFSNLKLRGNAYLVLGSLGTIYMLLLTSFDLMWETLKKIELVYSSQEFYITLFLLLIAIGVLIYGIAKQWISKIDLTHYTFLIFTIVFFAGFNNKYIPLIIINLLILAIGILTIKKGADTFHFGISNYGLLIIAVLIVCRFFDTDMSFVIRGILFLGFGLGFFLTNYFMLKRQKEGKMNLKK
ncbi:MULTISPECIES: DUF2157 domain-containing protein [Aestuariivivens]|uniref:DUF2157 domain-containing protein n=1 Tax=Aestuariivivens TaxID=1820275 RepID=UPI001CC1AE4C|nr:MULTISPECIES: DUF2157 domain-containing protein [Aestuariivivens]